MFGNRKLSQRELHEFMVFIEGRKFTFESFENAIETLDRAGILSVDGAAKDPLERRAVPSCDELVETWP
jgi:hypothetical protein